MVVEKIEMRLAQIVYFYLFLFTVNLGYFNLVFFYSLHLHFYNLTGFSLISFSPDITHHQGFTACQLCVPSSEKNFLKHQLSHPSSAISFSLWHKNSLTLLKGCAIRRNGEVREADRNTAQSIDQNKLQPSQKKRSYWLQKYVLSLVVFLIGIWVVKGLIGGNTCLDWIMSAIVGGGFGLVNFAWWKAREGRVDAVRRELIEKIGTQDLFDEIPPAGGEPGATRYYITDDPFD